MSNLRGYPKLAQLPTTTDSWLTKFLSPEAQQWLRDFFASIFRELTDLRQRMAKVEGASSSVTAPQSFTSSGSYTNSTSAAQFLLITATAAGGGGGGHVTGSATTGAGGGGAGQRTHRHPIFLAAGATLTVTIGAKGTGGTAGDNDGVAGGDTTYGDGTVTYTLLGGSGGSKGTVRTGGNGGGSGVNGITGTGGAAETSGTTGTDIGFWARAGAGGGGGANATVAGYGGPCEIYVGGDRGGAGGRGGGGGSSPWGKGGAGSTGNGVAGSAPAATSYGAGGGGGGCNSGAGASTAGGDGVAGYLLIEFQ